MAVKEVYPLDLMEFSMALGLSEEVMASMRDCWERQVPVDAVVHVSMLRLVRLYLVVGGMPAAVNTNGNHCAEKDYKQDDFSNHKNTPLL